ncbi:MAG: extracellular solute-binding protein [Bifidobacteriaceae bacterium]|jgi:multiple sugar transport system substrate-binding protein|nr:extracellular solute-binding protein [Bifidobacteriaceae bacterium]
MKKTTLSLLTALAAASALALTACGGGDETPSGSPSPGNTGGSSEAPAAEPVTITMSGWSLETTPEFQVLADAFHAANPDVTVEIKEYDANDYGTLMLADMSAGAAPDIITIKEAKALGQWVDGGQLLDVTDVVSGLASNVSGAGSYTIDGVNYAAPYRQDSWVLYYNIDLFAQAGIDPPDGTWTWDDYAATAKELTSKLGGPKGAYEHSWQSTLQGFAQAQTPGADLAGGQDYSYLKPYYERVLDLQDSGAQEAYGNISTNKLTYQGQFGKQEAAMMAMGSWYVATLLAQQASGEADSFAWGIAPIPQYDSSTTGTDKVPVTFGDPTGLAINAGIDESKLEAAKAFLAFAASDAAGVALAEIGIVSSVASDAVTAAYFGQAGIPADDLSKFAMSTHDTRPENPQSPNISAIQTALGEAHSAIMSESSGIDEAIAQATETIQAEIG